MNTAAYSTKTIGIVATATILGAGLLFATIASADNGTGYRGGMGERPTECTGEQVKLQAKVQAQDGTGYRGGNGVGKGERRGGGMGERRGALDGAHRGAWAQ